MKSTAVKMDDFYKLEYRTGSVTNQLTNERMQIFPAIRWSELRKELTEEIHESAPLAVMLLGSTLGSVFVEEMMNEIGEPESLAKHLADLATAAGWGVVSMTGDLRYGSRYFVTVANCVFCEKEELATTPQCDFLEGILKGMADRIFGTPHKVKEQRCAAMGESLCQFIVEECLNESETILNKDREFRVVEDLEEHLGR